MFLLLSSEYLDLLYISSTMYVVHVNNLTSGYLDPLYSSSDLQLPPGDVNTVFHFTLPHILNRKKNQLWMERLEYCKLLPRRFLIPIFLNLGYSLLFQTLTIWPSRSHNLKYLIKWKNRINHTWIMNHSIQFIFVSDVSIKRILIVIQRPKILNVKVFFCWNFESFYRNVEYQ